MELYSDKLNASLVLKAAYKNDLVKTNLVETDGYVTEYLDENIAYLYLSDKEKTTAKQVADFVHAYLLKNRYDFQVDIASFTPYVKDENAEKELLKEIFLALDHDGTEIYNAKSLFKKSYVKASVYLKNIADYKDKLLVWAKFKHLKNFTKRLQNFPPNIANSEWIADQIVAEAQKHAKVDVKVLGRQEAIKNNMSLYLSVNKGSMFEPRVVVLTYLGNPESKEKIAIVGKGITFDSGGYNLKPDKYMNGMKFDMSGAAIACSTIMALSETNAKVNAVAVAMLTDNRINGDASLPDSIVTSMSGITVEINNTDAEGRLVLADGLTYAIEKEKATEVIDIATLTGAILYTFGREYTGVWSSNTENYKLLAKATKKAHEKVWRMPLHDNYLINMKGSKLADLYNTDYSGLGGSNSAAIFLRQFAKNVSFMHLDIAGTADKGDLGTAAMMRPLVYYLKAKGAN
ncbi:M17 family metallopeptidase [Mycoplasmopsis agassizii]|uniref:M17 family metallopeptidase n=1 Tax=Mycoplasmopsis agassizii TaxID=33922 RepID=UPI003528C737